jgi:hypothetical protein
MKAWNGNNRADITGHTATPGNLKNFDPGKSADSKTLQTIFVLIIATQKWHSQDTENVNPLSGALQILWLSILTTPATWKCTEILRRASKTVLFLLCMLQSNECWRWLLVSISWNIIQKAGLRKFDQVVKLREKEEPSQVRHFSWHGVAIKTTFCHTRETDSKGSSAISRISKLNK